jgi:long-chain acyl-CoA synthetase
VNIALGHELYARYSQLAAEHPDELALIVEREPFVGLRRTWAELLQRSDDIGRYFVKRGGGPDTRCAVVLDEHPDVVPLLLAIWKSGASAVLLDKAWGAARRQRVIEHAGATLIAELPQAVEIDPIALSDTGAPRPPFPPGTAMLGYTSGSTGDPKGVAFTHGKLALTMQAAAAAIVARRGSAPRRLGCSMRLSGSGVLNLHYTWAAFSDAAVVVLPELKLETAKGYWSRVEQHQVEQMFLVPPLIALLNHLALPPSATLSPPICLTGSAPLSPRVQAAFQRRFGLPLYNAYGLSETMCASFFGHVGADGVAENGVGVPWLLEARLRDVGGEIIRGAGRGELELAGPTLFDGYYDNATATSNAFAGRWFRTGDVASRDQSGRYSIVGRLKEAVMKGGFCVYLNEVEESALAVDGVLEAAALQVDLPQGGEDIALIVRVAPASRLPAEDVLKHVREDLGAQLAPSHVVRIDLPMPRTGQDKLDRAQIARLWADLSKPGLHGTVQTLG